jgi:hypothetical protein
MSSDEADPESSSVMQLQKSSGSDGDAKDSAETKDSTMQLLAKMLGHPTEMKVGIVMRTRRCGHVC